MAVKGGATNTLDELAAAIDAAAAFPHLAEDVETARALHVRWGKRAEAVAKLEAVVEEVGRL
jgi:hypothetical protein